MAAGVLTNIQHFSLEDGPGIRTVLFLKGCPFRCKWCGNPETQNFQPEWGWSRGSCIGCGSCVKKLGRYGVAAHAAGVVWPDKPSAVPGQAEVERVCPARALHVIGKTYAVSELIAVLLEQKPFFDATGGVTLSGGEPLAQADFVQELLHEAHQHGIKTAIETTSHAPWETVQAIAQEIDYYMTDIKVIDREVHQKWTGAANDRVLENIGKLLCEMPALPVRIRTPVIPGVNDTPQAIEAIGRFLKPFQARGNLEWELLPYHRLGVPKYEALHRQYPMGRAALPEKRFQELRAAAKAAMDIAI